MDRPWLTAAETVVILAVAVAVVVFAPTPLVAVLICVSTVTVLYGSPRLVTGVVGWWQQRAAVSEQRVADAVAAKATPGRFAAGLDPTVIARTFRTDPPAGRHRRPDGDLPAGAVSATGVLRRIDAAAVERHQLMLQRVDAEQAQR